MKKTKFSIIIPMYNIQEYIEKCINSVLQQDYEDYEIIVVNDGSTDNSERIVSNIKNEKLLLINKPNGGLSSARNEGIKYATGDYIWFVDGDDYIEKDALRILNSHLQKEKYDVISFRYYKVYKKNKILQIDRMDINDKKQYPLVNTSAWGKIYRKDFYIKNNFRFTDGKIYEDLSLIPFIMCKAEKVKFIEEPLYNYIYRVNSIMNPTGKFKENRDDKFFAISTLYQLFQSEGIKEEYKEELEYLAIRHLLLVYSTEILPYKPYIYKDRCIKVLKYMNNVNPKWYKNQYLKKSANATKIYVLIFRMKLFGLCKICLKIIDKKGKK